MRSTVLVLAATSFALSASRPADACSPPPCWGGAFVPGNHGRVPANAPALFWRPMSVYDDQTAHPANVVLTRAADPTTPIAWTAQPFGFGDFLFVPDAPLAPGDYVLTDHTACACSTSARRWMTWSARRVAGTVRAAARDRRCCGR